MARTLNNEVDILNIQSIDNDIRDYFTRAMITQKVNAGSTASSAYSAGEFFIHYDRTLCKAITDILVGDTITPSVNVEVVTIVSALEDLYANGSSNLLPLIFNVETGARASKTYSADQFMIWTDSKLYKVTTTVTSGTAWAVGTNISLVANYADEIASSIQTLTNQVAKAYKSDDATETTIDDADYIPFYDSSANAMKKVLVANANFGSDNEWRTGLRFKNLGTSFTAAQATALANGDLSEFWNGDYWVIGGHNWRIVDNSGIAERKGDIVFHANTDNKVTSLVIMPDDNLVAAEAYLIDNTDSSGHGYANCAYRTRTDGKGKAQCKTIIANAFGSAHIASHRELMSSARGTGGATSWGWQDADVELPSEANIYGHSAFSAGLLSGCYSPGYNIGTEWGQFMLFRLAPYMAINRSQNYWLRDICSASHFAFVNGSGAAGNSAPSNPNIGLRPHFILI